MQRRSIMLGAAVLAVGMGVPGTALAAYVPATSPGVTCADATKTVVASGFSPSSTVTVTIAGASSALATNANGVAAISVAGQDLAGSTITASGPTPPDAVPAATTYVVPAGQCTLAKAIPSPSPSTVVASQPPAASPSPSPVIVNVVSTPTPSPSAVVVAQPSPTPSAAAENTTAPSAGGLAHTGAGNVQQILVTGLLALLAGGLLVAYAARRRRAH